MNSYRIAAQRAPQREIAMGLDGPTADSQP
jgi:hypothetical protein